MDIGNDDLFNKLTKLAIYMNTHSQTTPWAPAILSCTPGLAGSVVPPWTALSSGMAGCWQINSILANSGRKHSIRILNQYLFLWEILIWAWFICFIKFLSS